MIRALPHPGAGGDPIRERLVVHAGVRTRQLRVEGAGPPVLLLHGYTDSADTWRPLLRSLHARGRAAIAVDMPGHGHADPPKPTAVLPQLRRFATAFAQDHPGSILTGNSLGGLSALLAGEEQGLPVRGLVPIGPAGLGYQPWFFAMRHLITPALIAGSTLPAATARLAVSRVFGSIAAQHPIPPEVVRHYASHFRDRKRVRGFMTMVHRLQDEGMPGCLDVARIEAPILILWGRHDWLVPPAGAKLIREVRPDAELEVWEDCGHCPQLEVPDRMADRIGRFVDAVDAAPMAAPPLAVAA
ncbi:MAG: alpha/beta hydrolase [Solirubrobacteraceae bacterium]|nr:alpha/beta hydrolase [Solirubrobacteraceae bacterium]